MTFKEYFVDNYRKTFIVLMAFFLISLIGSLATYEPFWWVSFAFLFLGGVFLPMAAYLTWLKK